ncbi:hypothetical protein C1M55_11595 [Rhodococcus qingshengii]|uniref:hypothetical protein n=1 Tax=Rhodococcus TaxID=1827 RepID=UPI0009767A13|nr:MULTISPECIES: hypothetical protein [Rhodococcus]AUS31687.1 hypothetical protein C1M55_11595 [Rhodococcus qingshengii]MCC4304205.1 hypothetical protein [Rhodococcus sp. 3-2]OMQ36728.1 hypothetical protein BK799_09030 [Rhodococcus sp. D-1]
MKTLASHCDRLESLALMDDLTDRHERMERRKLWRGRTYVAVTLTGLCITFAYTLTGYLNGYAA